MEALIKEVKKYKINTLMIMQNNQLVLEYYKNRKQINKLQHLNSVTKSVLSILIGIALDKGYIESVEIPIYPFFKELLDETEERKKDLTLYHLLTMTDGLDFPEFGEWNYFSPMNFESDIASFVLNREALYPAGTHMNYSSGDSHLLSATLQKVTDMKTEEFADKYLFKPLGITEYRWYLDKQGINKGADGLRLKIDDMMKIGLLMLEEGKYDGKQIVSEKWIHESTKPRFLTYPNIGHYGMHWWVGEDYFFALGYGGQYIILSPGKKLVIAMTSEIYDNSLLPINLLKQTILS